MTNDWRVTYRVDGFVGVEFIHAADETEAEQLFRRVRPLVEIIRVSPIIHRERKTPQTVLDAIYTLAQHTKQRGYKSCVVTPNGGCSFHLDNILESYSDALNAAATSEEQATCSE